MAKQVCSGAQLKCSFGAAPAALNVMPGHMGETGGPAAANIMDFVPMTNIPAFGMCRTPSNPAVAAATAAASGVLTPVPCVPVVMAPWAPGASMVLIGNMPALNDASKCICSWGGVIEVADPGQVAIDIP